MNKFTKAVQVISDKLPLIGILAFSLCSTWSVFNLLQTESVHPTVLYWIPAILVELITAGIIHQLIDSLRKLTRSNQTKQDKRFYTIVFGLFLLCAVPTIGLSVWANTREFQHFFLGSVFPVSAIACAVWAALPETETKYQQERAQEKREKEQVRKEREKARLQKEREEERRRQVIAELGKSAPVFELYLANPGMSQIDAANKLGMKRQNIAYHLNRLERLGKLTRNGKLIEIEKEAI